MSLQAGFRLMLCCNDERGNHTGKLVALGLTRSFEGLDLLSIDCVVDGEELAVDVTRDPAAAPRFWLGKRWFQHHGHASHVGNLLWDSVLVTADVAALAVNHVIAARTQTGTAKYEISEAVSRIFGRAEVASLRSIDLIRA